MTAKVKAPRIVWEAQELTAIAQELVNVRKQHPWDPQQEQLTFAIKRAVPPERQRVLGHLTNCPSLQQEFSKLWKEQVLTPPPVPEPVVIVQEVEKEPNYNELIKQVGFGDMLGIVFSQAATKINTAVKLVEQAAAEEKEQTALLRALAERLGSPIPKPVVVPKPSPTMPPINRPKLIGILGPHPEKYQPVLDKVEEYQINVKVKFFDTDKSRLQVPQGMVRVLVTDCAPHSLINALKATLGPKNVMPIGSVGIDNIVQRIRDVASMT